MESLDITSEDPFITENFAEWRPSEYICDLDNAYNNVYCDDQPWKIVKIPDKSDS